MKAYQMELCGVRRTLPFIPINDTTAFASFVVLSDTELVSACAPEMARRIGISPSRLHALSRSEWGLSPQAWLAERRIGHVRKWLAESDLPIADLALRAGYADQSALTRAMQRLTGLTPAAYRRQTRLEQKNRSPEQDSRTRP